MSDDNDCGPVIDAELQVMARLSEIIETLDEDVRARVLIWAAAKYDNPLIQVGDNEYRRRE